MLGIEIPVWKVRSEHQQDFAVHHGMVARGKSEQAGQTDVKRVVVFNKFFAAQGMHNGSLELTGNLDQLCMGSGATRAAEDRDLFRSIQKFGKDVEFFFRWTNAGFRFVKTYTRPLHGVFQSYVPGQHNHGNSTLRDCRLNGGLQDARHLFGIGDELAIMTALRKEIFGISLLKVSATNLPTRNMWGNGEYWNTVALTIVKAIDQMHVAGPAAPSTHCQCSREMRFGSGGKSPRLLIPHVH